MSSTAATSAVLAFDTSTEWLAVALELAPGRVLERREPGGARASQRLLPLVQELLREAGIGLHDLALIGFGAGPGAFTGLRAACTAAQGLAYGLQRPVVPVNTLLAVAAGVEAPPPWLLVANDARMGELYWSVAASGPEPTLCQPVRVDAPAAVAAAWLQHFGACPDAAQLRLCGNAWAEHGAALAQALPAGWSTALNHALTQPPSAAAVAALARAAWMRGEAVDAEHALPVYVRDKVALTSAERAARRG